MTEIKSSWNLLLFALKRMTQRKSINNLWCGRSQNTAPIASTQVAIKDSRTVNSQTVGTVRESGQLATRHSREHTLSAVGPDAQVE